MRTQNQQADLLRVSRKAGSLADGRLQSPRTVKRSNASGWGFLTAVRHQGCRQTSSSGAANARTALVSLHLSAPLMANAQVLTAPLAKLVEGFFSCCLPPCRFSLLLNAGIQHRPPSTHTRQLTHHVERPQRNGGAKFRRGYMTATEQLARNIRPEEIAERVRQYHELMAPHIEVASRIIQREQWAITIGPDGSSIERVPTDAEKMALDYLTDTSRLVAKSLALGDFFIGGS